MAILAVPVAVRAATFEPGNTAYSIGKLAGILVVPPPMVCAAVGFSPSAMNTVESDQMRIQLVFAVNAELWVLDAVPAVSG